jgi:hypothetical protein
LKTPWGWPAAAQISSNRNSSRSISVTGGLAWPIGETPPIANPVFRRTKSASARPTLPTSASTFFSSTRRSPEVITSTAASSDRRRKMMLLAIWPTPTPQRVGGLLRGARRVVQHHRPMRVPCRLQGDGHPLHALRQGLQFRAAHHAARLFRIAVAAREFGLRSRKPLMNAPASTSKSRSMLVSTPMPCNMNTTSSDATLPVAPLA